jgi:hypothetical protein
MSKQSNEVMAAARNVEPGTGSARGKGNRPNRDEFVEAKNHADDVLGLDEKVSDGLRRAMARFKNSPLTLMMEVLNDPEQPWERRLDAAERAKPYLHRKLEDKHGAQASGNGGGGNGAGSSPASTGPTINLTVNRPKVTVNERQREVAPAAAPKQSTAARHEQAQSAAAGKPQQREATARPKAFKKPKKVAK